MKQETEQKRETQEEADSPGNKDLDRTQWNEVPIARSWKENRDEERVTQSRCLCLLVD